MSSLAWTLHHHCGIIFAMDTSDREQDLSGAVLGPVVPIPSVLSTASPTDVIVLSNSAVYPQSIPKLLRGMLERSGISIGEAARRLEVNPNTISQYLNGRRSKPSIQWLV